MSKLGVSLILIFINFSIAHPVGLEEQLLNLARSFHATQRGEDWFIEAEGDLSPDEEYFLLQKLYKKVERTLEYYTLIPEIGSLYQQFQGKLVPTIFSDLGGGVSKVVVAPGGNPRLPGPDSLEICFYGRFAWTHPKINRRSAFYDISWQALFVGAYEFGDSRWFDAIIIHEFLHAKAHRDGAPSATALMLSDLWIREELEAHDIEEKVLDKTTGGSYLKILKGTVEKRQANSLEDFWMGISPGDLEKVDQLFEKARGNEASLRMTQYLHSLTGLWLLGHYSGEELLKQRTGAYRQLFKVLG